MDYLIGLDIGTTNCKALAIDLEGTPVAQTSLLTPSQPPSASDPVASPEYNAESLWRLSADLIQRVLAQLPDGWHIAGICVASMGEAGVLVGKDGMPLAPTLTWHDRRTVPYVEWWRQQISAEQLYKVCGLRLDYIYSANKLMWHRDHQPQEFAQAATWLCVSDWIAFRLSGQRATSYSLASRTMLFDVGKRIWSEELLSLVGISIDLMPQALPSGVRVGEVTQEAAQVTGLPDGTPVVTGGHDHACAAIAAGASESGVVLDSAGTAEAFLGVVQK